MFSDRKILHIFFLVIYLIPYCSAQHFKEVSQEIGVDQLHVSLSYMGGGVAFFDYNNDGFEDLIITGGSEPEKLFKNNGDGTFSNVGYLSGFTPKPENYDVTSVITGDINNDGFRDVFLTTSRIANNKLFINNGNGTFSDISISAGINEKVNSMSASFGDINLDGYLDIYVVNYVENAKIIVDNNDVPIGYDHDCFSNYLYINNGDNTFSEKAENYGVANIGCGLATTITDINNDSYPDIYVANDFGGWLTKNTAYINQYPEGKFEDESQELGLDIGIFGMGIAVGDYNGDALLDYYVTNLGRNVLLANNGDGIFVDKTDEAGVQNESVNDKNATGWGTEFLDFDNDGLEDLFVANGFIPSAPFVPTSENDPNKLYRNSGDGSFEDISLQAGIANQNISRGMGKGDIDNDGDIDIVVTVISRNKGENNKHVLVYENQLNNNNSWLKIKLEGVANNKDAFGAKIYAYAGDFKWVKEVSGGASHASQSSSIQHFGLGEVEDLDSLIVIWPGGFKQLFEDIGVNEILFIKEGESIQIAGCTDSDSGNYNPDATYSFGCIENGSSVTGILDEIKENKIITYPNPVGSILTFNFPGNLKQKSLLKVELFNVLGNRIIAKNLSNNYELDVSSLQKGVYIYKLSFNGKIKYGKVYKN